MITDEQVSTVIDAIKASVYSTDSGIKFSAHPLYQTIWTHQDQEVPPGFSQVFGPRWLEKHIRHKLEILEQAREKEDWAQYVFIHERPYRVDALRQLVSVNLVNPHDLPKLILDVWIDTESPHQSYEDWDYLFNAVTCDELNAVLVEEEITARDKLPAKITLYRGADPQYPTGYSFTLDEEKAYWFANRFGAEGKVRGRVVPKDVTVGPLMGRGEDEMIVYDLWRES